MAATAIPEPSITRDDARGLWVIDEEMIVPTMGYQLVIPKGFACDLASVPRLLWPVIAPFELSCVGPIVHDWLYEHGGTITTVMRSPNIRIEHVHVFSRLQADQFLFDLMTQEGVPEWRRKAAYYAVRWFGRKAWQA